MDIVAKVFTIESSPLLKAQWHKIRQSLEVSPQTGDRGLAKLPEQGLKIPKKYDVDKTIVSENFYKIVKNHEDKVDLIINNLHGVNQAPHPTKYLENHQRNPSGKNNQKLTRNLNRRLLIISEIFSSGMMG